MWRKFHSKFIFIAHVKITGFKIYLTSSCKALLMLEVDGTEYEILSLIRSISDCSKLKRLKYFLIL